MVKKIAIFYHCLFVLNEPGNVLQRACSIVHDQMQQLIRTGLVDEASHFLVGINGGLESVIYRTLFVPQKAECVYHGLQSHAENLTIVELEKWAPAHPDWNVLYFHSKGCTHPPNSSYGLTTSDPWRKAMMDDLITNWRTCVADLDAGHDIACSHFMWNMADGTQHIPAGNFLWVKSDFAAKLPSIFLRDRIKTSGIAAAESRFEAEVYWGNGPKPNVKQYRPNGGGGVP